MRRLARLGVVGLLAAACVEVVPGFDPTVGPVVAERCVDADSDPSVDVSFARDLRPIIERTDGPGCGCHLPSRPNPIGVQESGLDLSSLAGLRAGGARSGASIVVPGRPCASILYLKTGDAPPVGSRMPFDAPPFLSAADRQKIADWIAEGADDD